MTDSVADREAAQSAERRRDDAHDRFADFERGVLQDNIALCDTKAGLLLAFTGAMVLFTIEALLTLRSGAPMPGWVAFTVRGLLGIGLVGFLASAQLSLTTVVPRMSRGDGADHVFWEAPIFKKPVEEYLAAMEALDPDVERADKLRHLYLQAGICRRKFAHFRSAMRLAQVAFVALAAAELVRVFG